MQYPHAKQQGSNLGRYGLLVTVEYPSDPDYEHPVALFFSEGRALEYKRFKETSDPGRYRIYDQEVGSRVA